MLFVRPRPNGRGYVPHLREDRALIGAATFRIVPENRALMGAATFRIVREDRALYQHPVKFRLYSGPVFY